MSTALYRRYRPETFAEVIGQEHVTEPLMVALEKNRVNHAYLFSGPRGCGKTTSARILARCLNCAQGPTPTPCGVCDSCRELSRDGGGSLDVIEMDAASHGGVDHARDLRERATLAPVRDRYKIFIIDEAHMVTREGFNALLKIVEEPPEHVKFIFATTEPNKVLGTIRSRTHHYPFRLVPPEVLLPFLQGLCDQEQVPVEPGVLQLVIRAGGGSVRDSLSILDQLMAGASSQNGIEYDRAVALLGYTHAQLLDEVIEALGAKNAPTLFGAVSRVVATGQDPRRFVEDLLERLRDLIVVKAVPQAAGQILQGVPQDQLERLAQQAQALGERELTVAAGTANETLNGMTGAANPQLQLELLCARLLLPAVEGSAGGAEVAALASRLQVLERRVASGATGSAPAGSGPAQGGMSAARAAGMAAAGLAPKTQVSAPQTSQEQAAPQQSGSQQGSSQQASAGAPPLAGAPLSAAPLAPTAQAPATQAPAASAGAPLAGNTPATPHAPAAPNVPTSPAAAAAGTPSAPLKLDPNDPLAAVQGNWRAILNRMSVPGAAEQLMKVRPARMDGATLYVSADIATLRAVKGFVPELTARVSEFLRRQVTIHAQVAKPGEQVKPVAQPAAPSAPAAQPAVPAAVAPQASQQPVQQTPPQPAQPAPLADGPRGGEDAWRRHGQPLTGANTPESTSVDAPLGAWEVAPIPQSAPEEAPQQAAPAVPVAPQAPAGPLAPEPPVAPQVPTGQQVPAAQQVPVAPAGGFGERDSFAASGSGVPQQESATEPQQAQEPQHAPDSQFAQEPPHAEEPPYEEEPPFEDEPAYAEPVEAPAAAAMPTAPAIPAAPAMPAEPVAPAGPLAAPVEPAGPLTAPVAPAGPLAAAGPLAEAPQAAAADNAPASDEKPAAQASNAPATPTPSAPTPSAPAAPARAASDEDYVSEDDEKVENSTFIGLRAIEKVIGGTVIDERPLHQP